MVQDYLECFLCLDQGQFYYHSPQSILEFSVPHAVDQRIQHRGDEGVNHRYYLASLRIVAGAGTQVDETSTSILQEDNGQVGRTGRERFVPPLS